MVQRQAHTVQGKVWEGVKYLHKCLLSNLSGTADMRYRCSYKVFVQPQCRPLWCPAVWSAVRRYLTWWFLSRSDSKVVKRRTGEAGNRDCCWGWHTPSPLLLLVCAHSVNRIREMKWTKTIQKVLVFFFHIWCSELTHCGVLWVLMLFQEGGPKFVFRRGIGQLNLF